MVPSHKHGLAVVACVLYLLGHAQGQINESYVYTSLSEVFPSLSALETNPSIPSPPVGKQDFPRCCLQAISESYIIDNGKVLNNPNKKNAFILLSPAELNGTQWPCGAEYADGGKDGAPEVTVPYSWCSSQCGGWQISKGTALTLSEWVQPFVGFILPSAVFCLNVPRKFVLSIGDSFFSNDFRLFSNKWRDFAGPLEILIAALTSIIFSKKKKRGDTQEPHGVPNRRKSSVSTIIPRSLTLGKKFMNVGSGFGTLCGFIFISSISTVIRALTAASIALLNTIVWVAIVFSAATPMMLSGFYEASLDRNIIKDMRGSLLAAEAWRIKDDIDKAEDRIGKREHDMMKVRFEERVHQLYAVLVGNLILPKNRRPGTASHDKVNTVWEDVQTLVERKRVVKQEALGVQTMKYAISLAHHKEVTATRLKGMLGSQSNFGATVGAPIVFFLGSFLFSVISNFSAVGDNNTSHALAFGMWWMTIPHVAIVSGCLLAGNNPNTLEAIVCGAVDPRKPNINMVRTGSGRWYEPFYDTAYTPVWMLERGRNKQQWIDRLANSYLERGVVGEDSQKRSRAFHLDFVDWGEIVLITIILAVFPFVLAFLTSYFTPRVGLSCRSLTFLIYFLFQILFSALWVWDFFSPHHIHNHPSSAAASNDLTNQPSRTLYYSLLAFVSFGSGFTAVVGTLLQIIGVYRNCLCSLPMIYWSTRFDGGDRGLVLSSNSALAIRLAREFWLPTGVASIVLLVVTCYGGWWYQSHWRREFSDVVTMVCRIGEGEGDADVFVADVDLGNAGGGKQGGEHHEYVIAGGEAGGEGHVNPNAGVADLNRQSGFDDIYKLYRRSTAVIIGKIPDGEKAYEAEAERQENEGVGGHGLPYVPGRPGSPEVEERKSSDGLLPGDVVKLGVHHDPYADRLGGAIRGGGGVQWMDGIEMYAFGEREEVKRKPLPS